jgi:DNA (cytosine-5)-methyltransferase 1
MCLNGNGGAGRIDGESETFVTCPLTGNPYGDHEARESLLVAHSLRADGFDASEDGTGRGTPLEERGRDGGRNLEHQDDLAYSLNNTGAGGRTNERNVLTPAMAVRRLTPRECERLQGFPDDYTLVHRLRGRKKPKRFEPRTTDFLVDVADSPRYKALGNSMAVPVLAWIGERIRNR